MTGALHSHSSNDHYTPKWVVEAARTVLKEIDLDPASNKFANEVVKATNIITEQENGLKSFWGYYNYHLSRVFVNPPGKVKGKQGSQAIWWKKACDELNTGNVAAIVFVSFSVELLQTAQKYDCPQPLDFVCCFPKSRIKFDREINGQRQPGNSPTHSNMIVCMAGPESEYALRFKQNFSQYGYIHVPG